MSACALCKSASSLPFTTRRDVPVHQNLLTADAGAARAATSSSVPGRPACFLWNAAFRPELLSYGPDYENTQTASPAFDQHVDTLVDALVAEGVTGREVISACGLR